MRGSALFFAILLLIIIGILYYTGAIEVIQKWLYKKFGLKYECEKIAGQHYINMIYKVCNLEYYNISKEDFSASTTFKDDTCYVTIYYKGKTVAELWYTIDRGSPVLCEDIKKAILG